MLKLLQRTTGASLLSPVEISRDVSNTIRVARVLCIYFMMLVHVSPGFSSVDSRLANDDISFFIRSVFSGFLGRASVPLLSVISGYLAVKTLSNTANRKFVWGRIKALIVPMVSWNVAGLLLGFLVYKLTGAATDTFDLANGRGVLEHIYASALSLNYQGYTEALNFLRDLFVVSAITPFLLVPAKKAPVSSSIFLFLVGGFFSFDPIIYRAPILMFFYLGLVSALHPELPRMLTCRSWAIKAIFATTLSVYLLRAFSLIPANALVLGSLEWFELLMRAIASLLIWRVARRIATKDSSIRDVLAMYSSDIYVAFLSHILIFGILWNMSWKPVFAADIRSVSYFVFYFSAPALVILIAPVLRRGASNLPTPFHYLITGKQIRRSGRPSFFGPSRSW